MNTWQDALEWRDNQWWTDYFDAMGELGVKSPKPLPGEYFYYRNPREYQLIQRRIRAAEIQAMIADRRIT